MNVNNLVNRLCWAGWFGRLKNSINLAATLLWTASGLATNYTWDCGAGPANDKWSLGNNWGIPDADNVAPADSRISGLANTVVPEPSAGVLILVGGGLLCCLHAYRRDRTPRF